MGLISSGPFFLFPLSAWWPFVYFAVVASPLYRVGFIGGFPYFCKGSVLSSPLSLPSLDFFFLFLFLFLY